MASLSQTNPFSIKFKIEPGKATYIGSFIFTATNRLGLTVTGVKVNFEDRFKNDIMVLKQKYLGLSDTELFMGLEENLIKTDIGGSSNTNWTIPAMLLPTDR